MHDFSYEKRKVSLLCSLQSYLLGDPSSFSNSVFLYLLEQTKGKKRKTEENYRTAVVSLTASNVQIVPSGYIDTFLLFIAHLEMRVTISLCRMLSSFSTEELTRKPISPRASAQLCAGLAHVCPLPAAIKEMSPGTGWHSVPTKIVSVIKSNLYVDWGWFCWVFLI